MTQETDGSATVGARIHRLAEATSELLAATSREAVAKVVTERLVEAAAADIGSLSVLSDPDTLELIGIRGVGEGIATRWATYPVSGPTPAAEAVRTRAVVHVAGLETIRARYPELPMAIEGERTLLCLPLVVGDGRAIGVLNLSFAGLREIDDAEMVFLRLLADTCATSLDRIDAQIAAAERSAKLELLAEATVQLTEHLDYEATLTAVAESAIGWFADWCAISVLEDGQLRVIVVAHDQPELQDTVTELLEDYPAHPDDPRGAYEVLRTGVTDLMPDVSDEILRQSARDERHLELLRTLELRSGLTCPLKVRDRIFGVITWVTGQGGRRFGPDDVGFGEEIAQRAAVAIDNAHLHSQIRDVALELQRAALPDALPHLDGWRTAVHYSPAGRTAAGGDFYDVVPIEDGRAAFFIGDVMGRGVSAASTMAQMRSSVRTLAAVDADPVAVAGTLDGVFHTLQFEQLVTMVYGMLIDGRVELVNCGHPEPLVLRADGSVEVVSAPDTLLLGVGAGDRSVVPIELGDGEALLLYTDGLTERRLGDPDLDRDRLVEAFAALRVEDHAAWLEAVVDRVRDADRDDDVAALLLVRTTA